jgi:ABC-type multidrug transport system ATPase subunit
MIVVASIHQPSTSTLLLFDNVLLLSEGKTVYYGPPSLSNNYFAGHGYPPIPMMSPAEFMLELTNVDFSRNCSRHGRLNKLVNRWNSSPESELLTDSITISRQNNDVFTMYGHKSHGYPRNLAMQSLILIHRMALVSQLYLTR